MDITTNQSGVLTIVLQRHLINAIDERGREDQYVVQIDGKKLGYSLNGNGLQGGKVVESDFEIFRGEPYDARVLQIPFTKDARHVQITGTWMRDFNTDSKETSFPCELLQDNCTIELRDSKAIGNKTFDIRYAVQGSEARSDPSPITVNDIYIDWAEKALVIETAANQSGYLTVILPEEVIHSWDSQIKPHDEQAELASYEDFWIRRNFGEGYNVEHYNLIGQEERFLNITLSRGTFEIQISGTGIIGGEKIPDELPLRPCERAACTYLLNVDNQTFSINYYMFGFRYVPDSKDPKVTAMELDSVNNRLIIDIEAEQRGKGEIVLYIPYDIIESTFPNSASNPFEVYIDGAKRTEYKSGQEGLEGNFKDPVYYQDANSFPPSPNGETLRVMHIYFDSGTKQIDIRDARTANLTTKEIGKSDEWFCSTIVPIGIGSAFAGIVAFIVLRKLS